MASAFDEAAAEYRQQGRSAYVRFALGELIGLVIGAGIEWMAKSTTDASVRGRSLPDHLLMRPPGVSWEAHYAGAFLPEDVREAQERTDFLVQRMVHAISHHDFQGARQLSNQEREARENLRRMRAKHRLGE
jgi:hypothetical protein